MSYFPDAGQLSQVMSQATAPAFACGSRGSSLFGFWLGRMTIFYTAFAAQ